MERRTETDLRYIHDVYFRNPETRLRYLQHELIRLTKQQIKIAQEGLECTHNCLRRKTLKHLLEMDQKKRGMAQALGLQLDWMKDKNLREL